jgi:hypothetical protein
MVVDWVMRQSTAGRRTGIQWTFTKQLKDLDFADDISLLSHKQQDVQEKLCRVAEEINREDWTPNQHWEDRGHEGKE